MPAPPRSATAPRTSRRGQRRPPAPLRHHCHSGCSSRERSWPHRDGCRGSALSRTMREAARTGRAAGYRRLLTYAAPHTRGWVTIVGATSLSTALSLVQPWPLKVLVDHVLGDVPVRGSMGAVIERLPWSATPGMLAVLVVLAGLFIFAVNSA